jgi:hypothetical protein
LTFAHDQVIKHPCLDERRGVLEPLGDPRVRLTRLGHAAAMITAGALVSISIRGMAMTWPSVEA